MIIQVGPRPNAVGCRLNPTGPLPEGHCEPLVQVGTRTFRATGSPRILRQLMDARFQAQSSGITIDGSIEGDTIAIAAVRRMAPGVTATRAAPTPVTVRRAPVLAFALTEERPSEARGFVHRSRFGRFVGRQARRAVGAAVGSIPVVGTVAAGFLPGGGPARGLPAPPFPRFTPQQVPGSVTPVALPETPTITTPAERSMGVDFQAVQGAFGLAAMAPFALQQVRLSCPRGMVLGRDDLCYPKQVLRRNSKFRKWRSGPRPPVSAADAKMFRRLNAARAAVERLAKSVDLQTKKKVNPK